MIQSISNVTAVRATPARTLTRLILVSFILQDESPAEDLFIYNLVTSL